MSHSTPNTSTTARASALALLAAVVCAVALAPALLSAAPAHASITQLATMQDDDLLINGTPQRADAALAQMKLLGVNIVRVTVLWSVVAQGAHSGRVAAHFRDDNPASYPRRNWDRFDNLVINADRLGIGVYFTVAGPPPTWARPKAPRRYSRDQANWEPNPALYYRFVKALGIRYSGRYHKEGKNGPLLPAVRLWGIWNEPNQAGWLLPQSLYSPIAHHVIPFAPILYRALYYAGHQALVDSGHGRDGILIGETAPLGSTHPGDRQPIAPKTFIRELLCVDPLGNPYTGVEAQARQCATLTQKGPLQASAWAHHPYSKKIAPTVRPTDPNWIDIANYSDLPNLLDQLAAKTGKISPGLGVITSEFGYETFPPDPIHGIPLDTQAEWMNIGDFLSWQNPRVESTAQLQLRDAKPDTRFRRGSRGYWDTYQAGLLTARGGPKPALAAFGLPLVTYSLGQTDPANQQRIVDVWGQLRFRSRRSAAQPADPVVIEYHADGTPPAAYRTLATLSVTDARGFFTAAVDVPGPGVIRAHWRGVAPPHDFKSRLAKVGQNGFG